MLWVFCSGVNDKGVWRIPFSACCKGYLFLSSNISLVAAPRFVSLSFYPKGPELDHHYFQIKPTGLPHTLVGISPLRYKRSTTIPMASVNPLSVGEASMCNFGATAWVMLQMLAASRWPRREAEAVAGALRWGPEELPVQFIQCWYRLAQQCVIYRENSESVRELRIHSCMQ